MDKYDLRLTQFMMAPAVKHAAAVLRAVVPAGRIGHFDIGTCLDDVPVLPPSITIENPEFRGTRKRRGRWTEIVPTDEQVSAIRLLVTVLRHHEGLLRVVHGLSETDSPDKSPEFSTALRCLNEDIRRKLNMDILSGGVIVYT